MAQVLEKSIIQQIFAYQHLIRRNIRWMTMYKSSINHIKQPENVDHVVDFRSDTVTKPCKGMKEAMMAAPVGDDVLEEDPSVTALEARIAEITNKEAGLFVTSGTLGNFLSVLAHTGRRGAEVLIGDDCHIHRSEQGNVAQFGGVNTHLVPTKPDGTFCLKDLQRRIRKSDFHQPSTQLICIENTHGNLGGKIVPLDWIDQLCHFAHQRSIPVHMDGARVFSASVASKVGVDRILQNVDSVSICLSKNLGAPIGSVIAGKKEIIDRARYLRKGLGGGWRQAGLIAAAGLYAIENNIARLAEDDKRAKAFASAIHNLGNQNIYSKVEDVQTNMVFLYVNPDILTPEDLCERMMVVHEEESSVVGSRVCVKAFPQSATTVRLVFHLDISDELLEVAISKLSYIIEEVDRLNY